MSSNPNRQRLMSPLDYLAALAGARPPEQEPAWAPGTDPRQMGHMSETMGMGQGMGQEMDGGWVHDAAFRMHGAGVPPMPFADGPPPGQQGRY
jgi:hypothetical protein